MDGSAPGKIILFGEHAVVHGRPALVGAISARLHTTISSAESSCLSIPKIGVDSPLTTEKPLYRFYSRGIELMEAGPLSIKISSEFPIGAGLGSSAAMACSFVTAASKAAGTKLTPEEIKNKAHEMEKVIHGNPSGVDTAVIAFGGFLRYQQGKFENLKTPHMPLTIGYTGKSGDTRETVANVKELLEASPEKTGKILDEIGGIAEKAQEMLYTKNHKKLGGLMDRNHELLQELGVSSPELDNLVVAAKDAGAYGAKLTGGGGGGCMVALGPDGMAEATIAEAIKNAGGVPIKVSMSSRGAE